MACTDKIISIKDPCTGVPDFTPLSGYDMTDYPGVTLQFAANGANANTQTGHKFMQDIRRKAMLKLANDITAYIHTNYRVNSIPSFIYKASEYRINPYSTIPAGTAGQRRGVVVSKKDETLRCRLFKMVVNRVRIYAGQTIDTTLRIADVGTGSAYDLSVSLEAGVIHEFEVNVKLNGNETQITLPSDIIVYASKPDCGCTNYKGQSEYMQTKGLTNGTASNDFDAYGIEVDMSMQCDLSTIACDMVTQSLIGQAAFELCGAMMYDEIMRNGRVNYLTIYKGEEIKAQAQAGFAAYREYMESAMQGMRNYLVQADGNCGCVDCSGSQIKANI